MALTILGEVGKENELTDELACGRAITAKCDNRFGNVTQKSNRIIVSTEHDVVILVEGFGMSEQHAIDVSQAISQTYHSVLNNVGHKGLDREMAMPRIKDATKELHDAIKTAQGEFGAYVTAIKIENAGNKVDIFKAGNIHAIILEVQRNVLKRIQPTLDHAAYKNPWNKNDANAIGSTHFKPDEISQQFSPLHQIVGLNTGIKHFADPSTIGKNVTNFQDGVKRIWEFTGKQMEDPRSQIRDTRSLVHVGPIPRPE